MFDWFAHRATEVEKSVAHAILDSAGDPRAQLLFEQLRAARRVERNIEGATLRVVVPWTTEDNRGLDGGPQRGCSQQAGTGA